MCIRDRHSLKLEVKIWPMPVETPNPIRFDQDVTHARYDPVYAHRFWRILVTIDAIFKAVSYTHLREGLEIECGRGVRSEILDGT